MRSQLVKILRLTVTCPDDGKTQVPVTLYVDEIKVIKPKDHTTDIVLDDKDDSSYEVSIIKSVY